MKDRRISIQSLIYGNFPVSVEGCLANTAFCSLLQFCHPSALTSCLPFHSHFLPAAPLDTFNSAPFHFLPPLPLSCPASTYHPMAFPYYLAIGWFESGLMLTVELMSKEVACSHGSFMLSILKLVLDFI